MPWDLEFPLEMKSEGFRNIMKVISTTTEKVNRGGQK
jgi:hypothetical protein